MLGFLTLPVTHPKPAVESPVVQESGKWFGPVTASFRVEFGGNPYDPEVNDVRVRFLGPKGDPIERIAYYCSDGTWKATLVAKEPGKYVPTLYRNGEKKLEQAEEAVLDATEPVKNGYIRRDTEATNRFRTDDGKRFVPIGVNLGWQTEGLLPMEEQIAKLNASGVNWTRIWANHWDGKNPWWPTGDPYAVSGELWPSALDRWQKLLDTCDSNGVAFQMVLFHHGAFSSKVNPNWQDHPWNAKNNGFLKDAADFFTDPEAKRRAKMWLRYAVARFGHHPRLMAWELFNEVEWVDARYADRWADIAAWHTEMAAFLRQIDPYGHLVTTSSELHQSDLWKAMDYLQPHVYPANLTAAIVGAQIPTDKPAFFGEFGPSEGSNTTATQAIRDGLLSGLFANHAGTAQYWYWDRLEKENAYQEFATIEAVLRASGWVDKPLAKPVPIQIDTESRTSLRIAPGAGWGKATRTAFRLPEESTPLMLAGLPSYLQSAQGPNKDLFPEPLVLRFKSTASGMAKFRVEQVAKAGANLQFLVNGSRTLSKKFPSSDSDQNTQETLSVPFPAGEVEIRVLNDGADWVRLGEIQIDGLAPTASAIALGEEEWLMARITAAQGAETPTVQLSALGLRDGDYTLSTFRLGVDKQPTKSIWSIRKGRLEGFLPPSGDVVVVFHRRSEP